MGIGEILFIIALAGGFLIPTALFKQWRLFFVFVIFFVVFGLMEWFSVAQTGLSISQHFWVLDEANPVKGWIIIGGMAIAWISLLIHLKMHKRK